MIKPFGILASDPEYARTGHEFHICFDRCDPRVVLTTYTLPPTSGCVWRHQFTDELISSSPQHVPEPPESPVKQSFLHAQNVASGAPYPLSRTSATSSSYQSNFLLCSSSIPSSYATVSSPNNRCCFSISTKTRTGLRPDTMTFTGSVASTNTLHFLVFSDLVFCLVTETPCFRKATLRRFIEGMLAFLSAAATTSRTKICLKVNQPFCSAIG
ncbi:unnamed protein product [Acanthosepion pharaonis]|uniref:Uncharacterized protein n=1 Tax=Acanthosepion pharaonis TaxID=158019 RepID=A0A812BQ41_ACAPH|nr:unnamed protein product [Sepia pharaonis]